MIGTLEEARTVLRVNERFFKREGSIKNSGWSYLGSGCSRHAFLSPTGVVYKVIAHPKSVKDINMCEALNFSYGAACSAWRSMIPKYHMFTETNVLAVEKLDKKANTLTSKEVYRARLLQFILTGDMDLYAGHNVARRKNGKIVVFDLGGDGDLPSTHERLALLLQEVGVDYAWEPPEGHGLSRYVYTRHNKDEKSPYKDEEL